MSSVPNSWRLLALNDVTLINPSKPPTTNWPSDTLVTFLPMPAVNGETGKIDAPVTRKIKEVSKGYTSFEDGDILFAKITPCMENGKSAIVEKTLNGIGFGSTEFHIIRPSSGVLAEYVHQFVRQRSFLKNAEHNMRGAVGQKRVPTEFVRVQKFPLPPLAEQHRIVAKIEELFSDLDAGIASLKKAKEQTRVYRKSLLNSAFTGSLTISWRKENTKSLSSANALLKIIISERQEKYKVSKAKWEEGNHIGRKPKQPSEIEPISGERLTELPDLPKSWGWFKIEDVGFVQLGRQRTPSKMSGKYFEKYIRAANITERGIDFGDVLQMDFEPSEIENFRLKMGDILLTEASGSAEHVGRPVIWPEVPGIFCFQNTVIRFQSIAIDTKYAYWLFLSLQKLGKFVEQAGGVGINHLSAGKFSEICIPIPPREEQLEIVEQIESRLSEADNLDKTLDAALAQSESLRQSILKQAFAGKLVPQDPNDEPAEKLLERIRAERAANEETPKKRGRYGGGDPSGTRSVATGNGTPVEGGAPKPRRGRPPGKQAAAVKRRG